MSRFHVCLCLAASFALSACDGAKRTEPEPKRETPADAGPLDGYVTVDRLPMPDDPHLLAGRSVWAGTCQACHGLGEAGSPKITDKKAWAPRIAQGIDTLHEHALKGFIGPKGTMMPEHGGNMELSDDDVIAAVDYMVSNSR